MGDPKRGYAAALPHLRAARAAYRAAWKGMAPKPTTTSRRITGMTSTPWKAVEDNVPCRKCGVAGQIEHSTWESSCGGYEDEHYRCKACGKDWWCEGPDA